MWTGDARDTRPNAEVRERTTSVPDDIGIGALPCTFVSSSFTRPAQASRAPCWAWLPDFRVIAPRWATRGGW